MKGINKVILVGNLGKDPEFQKLEGDISIAKFPLATTERYKDRNGETKDQTEWHNIIAWRQLADISTKYLHKGSAVYIEGKIRTTNWTDKDNNKKYRTEIVAETINILDKRTDGNGHTDTTAESTAPVIEEGGDDLPF
ncbi:MAG: single-stranded DNA-binding protein [Bacteroidota bacterium]|jgi:single-strand DNA-binding protein